MSPLERTSVFISSFTKETVLIDNPSCGEQISLKSIFRVRPYM